MKTQFDFDAAEFEKLDTLGEKALGQANVLRSGQKVEGVLGVDVCDTVRKITPILKTVQAIVCGLKFVPGVKQACKALELVIPALDSICPAQTEKA